MGNTSLIKERWTKQALWQLIWPLIVEQVLLVSIGMADTLMVTSVGEAAVSGISLVDAINILILNVFAALATGGAVVVSQYLGRRDAKSASLAAKHLLYSITLVSVVIMVVALALRTSILTLIYGHIDAEVMQNADIYFWLSAVSYPFMAVYNAGAALLRSMGNSKVSMLVSLMINIINIGGNALLIFGLGWGVAGAATSSLASRVMAAVVVVWLLCRENAGPVSLRGLLRYQKAKGMVGSIFRVGLPNALENSTFQVGKLLVARIVSTFGTAAIAGNAIAGNISMFNNVAGMAIGLGMVTVIGQCVGARDYEAARLNTRRLMIAAHASMLAMGLLLVAVSRPLLGILNLSAEAVSIAEQCTLLFGLTAGVFWPPSFALPNALRAAGDARYTMVVSMLSMWIFRIGSAFFFAYAMGLGVFGVWIGMVIDWVVRGIAFLLRWRSGRWKEIKVIK